MTQDWFQLQKELQQNCTEKEQMFSKFLDEQVGCIAQG